MPPYQNYPYSSPYAPTNYMQRAYAPQTPQMAQPQQQAQVQPQMQMPMAQQMPPMEMPIQDIKYVNRAQAEAYIVFPNTKVMLIDKESGIAYVKTADGMGQTQTDYFRFDRVNADGSPIKPQEPAPQVDFNQFIKREDLEKFGFVTVSQYNELAQKLEQIQKRLEGAKQNVGQPKQPEARV
jgi:23S rRNA-/tRNA-specific pseudouridylate synthase